MSVNVKCIVEGCKYKNYFEEYLSRYAYVHEAGELYLNENDNSVLRRLCFISNELKDIFCNKNILDDSTLVSHK